jgi:hypothetical protein
VSIPRGRDRGGFRFSRGGADEVGSRPNEEGTTMDEAKSARSLWVGRESGSRPTRLTWNTQKGP